VTFVDTSVWVAWLRRGSGSIRERLDLLLDEDRCILPAPVRIELLSGMRAQDAARWGHLLLSVPTRFPAHSTWALAESWCATAARKGDRFGVGDLLVAALAHEGGGRIWSLDGDFARMARLGFIRLDDGRQ
jgi:predicted nucleic acid-binding protein